MAVEDVGQVVGQLRDLVEVRRKEAERLDLGGDLEKRLNYSEKNPLRKTFVGCSDQKSSNVCQGV